MLLIIHGTAAVSFVILGIMFLCGKGSFLIAGYNTASKAEKEKIDEKKLCRYVGKLMFAFAGCFLILMASGIFLKRCGLCGWASRCSSGQPSRASST